MNKLFAQLTVCIVAFLFCPSLNIQAQTIIKFDDLHFHSEFEKLAINNYLNGKPDTLEIFLSIDESISKEIALKRKESYRNAIQQLIAKKVNEKKLNKKIRLTYSNIHNHFLRKYQEVEYFPKIFETGIYNCVSASILYAMVFEELNIPYKVKASATHVYLVANPGENSVVIETTNPGIEKQIFTGEFKSQYVSHLKKSKLISDVDLKSKSTEEIFEEDFKKVKDADFNNLIGIQYYNKAINKLQYNDTKGALDLGQKAYFFYPDEQIKQLLYTCLAFHIEKCTFQKLNDINYLAQLSRIETVEDNIIVGIFNNVIHNQLQYTDKEAFCDSLYTHFVSQLDDKKLIKELSFSYNMQMSYLYQNTDKLEKYILKAISIKGNHRDAKIIMKNHVERKLFNLRDPKVLLDSINKLEERITHRETNAIIQDHKLRALLELAYHCAEKKKITECNKYLLEFEKSCQGPVEKQMLYLSVENAYRKMAAYYYYKGYRTKARTYVNRGLKYIPDSRILKAFLN